MIAIGCKKIALNRSQNKNFYNKKSGQSTDITGLEAYFMI